MRVVEALQIGQAEIQQITAESLENLLAAECEQLETQARMAFAERPYQLHRVEPGQRHYAQAQRADQLAAARGGLGQQSVLSGQQATRPGQDALTFGREAFEALATNHQLQTELVFQGAQAHRQRRLGDVTARRRLAEMPRFVERHEKLQLLDVHARSVCIEGSAGRTLAFPQGASNSGCSPLGTTPVQRLKARRKLVVSLKPRCRATASLPKPQAW